MGNNTSSGQPPLDPKVVVPVDLTRYVGTWYEHAAYPQWFSAGCTDTTAQYALTPEGQVSVTNTCTNALGLLTTARGTATPVAPGRLSVAFEPWNCGRPANPIGNYWILYLNADYTVAIVGSPDRSSLWYLARSKTPLTAETLADLDQRVRSLGFTVPPRTRA